jgi:hypothetical protein
MRSRFSLLFVCLAFAGVASAEDACPVTKAPDPPFRPPAGFDAYPGRDGRFFFGTPDLWVVVTPTWKLGRTGRKLPYFSQHFFYGKSEVDPRMAVVARRVDSPAPLVWSDWVNGGGPSSGEEVQGFMVTSLPIPTAGCWEITAHFTPARDKIHTLTYTVRVEP